MMSERELLDLVNEAKRAFGTCGKFSGALTTELLGRLFRQRGFLTSRRDVFIRGVPIEIDLLIPHVGAEPEHDLIYAPADVQALFEVKNRGSFGEAAVARIRSCFLKAKGSNPEIRCIYVTLIENKRYKWRITEDNLGFPAYTLFWQTGSESKPVYEATGDWQRLLDYLDATCIKAS